MTRESYVLYLEDMLDAMNRIERYITGATFETFVQDTMMSDAVLRNIEIIGEAAKNVPEHAKNRYGAVPWRRIIGLRNIVIHGYFGVDMENIWEIITKNIPEVKNTIVSMLEAAKR